MIGSFWNLCRACPSMPVDKLHSEYRSTYRWHEYTGGPEVVRRPPVPNQQGSANEPPLPRRKKCPELAYRTTHDFVPCDDSVQPVDKNLGNNVNRARSEERGTPSRRSKSAGPPGSGRSTIPMTNGIGTHVEEQVKTSGQAGESSGLFKKTISKLSTEYRIQFVWPHVRRAIKGGTDDVIDPPRKSLSMGAIKSAQTNKIPMIHKKRTTNQNEAAVHELEPLVRETEEKIHPERNQPRVDFRKGNRPYSHYDKNASDREKFGFVTEDKHDQRNDNKIIPNGYGGSNEPWYKEVIELRKKAGEYKCRGWGMEIDPDLYKKQRDLWDQVSRRTSLSALSLASTVRPITKEEKEKENNKKSSPTKAVGRFPGHALPLDNKSVVDGPLFNGRMRRHTVRHHLERTTGPDVEEGALLPSPTREKLMPTIPKSKDDDSVSSQRGSPKKSAASRHGSPQKGSPQKGSPKKMTKVTVGRSQSVGPGVVQNESSPKRQIRSGNTAGNTTTAVTPTAKPHKKTPVSTPTGGERRPRPTTLSTTVRNRSKSSSLPPNVRAHSAPNNNHNNSQIDNSKASPSTLTVPNLRKTNKSLKQQRPKSSVMNDSTIKTDDHLLSFKGRDKNTAETDDESADKDGGTSISSASPLPPQEITEHIVKSPPEPTRVKSPEQILMRSPDPVNWTVPLDTGKTFTVTQNVRDDPLNRPQSEFKASTPVDKPPPPPLSAPPELAEQAKMEAWKSEQKIEPDTSTTTSSSITPNIPEVRYDKPVPGSTLRCLEDPIFDPEINSPSANRNPAVDVLEKARNRFDRFWGGNNTEKEEEENV